MADSNIHCDEESRRDTSGGPSIDVQRTLKVSFRRQREWIDS